MGRIPWRMTSSTRRQRSRSSSLASSQPPSPSDITPFNQRATGSATAHTQSHTVTHTHGSMDGGRKPRLDSDTYMYIYGDAFERDLLHEFKLIVQPRHSSVRYSVIIVFDSVPRVQARLAKNRKKFGQH